MKTLRIIFLFLFILSLVIAVTAGDISDGLVMEKIVTLSNTTDIRMNALSIVNFYDNSSYDLNYRNSIYQSWQPIVEYDEEKGLTDGNNLTTTSARIVDNKIEVKTESDTKINFELTNIKIKETIVLEKKAKKIYYKYSLKSFDKVFNTFNASETTHVHTFGQELSFDKVTKVTQGNITRDIALAKDNTPTIERDKNGNLSILVNEVEVYSIQKPLAIDAEGTLHEMEFILDKTNKTVEITGDLSKAVYPVYVDPTTSYTAGQNYDGHVYYAPGSATFQAIRDYSGTSVGLTTATWNSFIRLYASSTSNQYQQNDRAVFLFNTSGLDDGCTVTGVKFASASYGKYNNIGSLSVGLTGFAPLSPTALSAGDYRNFTKERWSDTDIAYASWTVSTHLVNNFTGNSLFISNVSKTGWTPVMLRLTNDIDNTTTGISWSSGAYTGFLIEDAGTGGAAPVLEVTYTLGSAPIASFTLDKPMYRTPDITTATDTSTNTPTQWNWSWGDGTWTNGTTQNPTHKYTDRGAFSVSLLCSNAFGSNTVANPTSLQVVGYENSW